MIKITLKDGKVLEVEKGLTVSEIAARISTSLRKKALGAKINGEKAELMDVINEDSTLEILTFEDQEGKDTLRHTASHILAQAVKRLYPEVKLAIGPSIENGFYYDFDAEFSFTPEILEKIEKEMNKIVKENLQLKKFTKSREDAINFMKERNEDYKVELIEDLPEESIISFYEQGDFVDLCAGPHVPSTKEVKAIKLLSVAGAYWRGNENNKMLQRIYGTAFTKKAELEEYLHMLEEAKKRDHRKLGKELGLFDLKEEGPGFPFFYPKGMILRNTLENYWREMHEKAGYGEIRTPIILNEKLWHQSGHWDHYKENMYFTKIDGEDYAIKPMNCPGSILVYKSDLHSYRELPIRLGELGLVHRHEYSGALHGLMRVRNFTQDDAHIFMTKEQITSEILGVIKMIDNFYSLFGFEYFVELSTRPEDSMGSDEDWEAATNGLIKALNEAGLEYKINEGDGAFYGPKIDFHLRDCLGRTWQCGTIQLDFQMPERFDLSYVGADGEKHRPVMAHRVIFGSIERFIGILTEHYAGAFPTWLAPVQVKIMNITDNQVEYCKEIQKVLNENGIRVELDLRNEKIGYKIREAQLQKIPYMLVLGDKEMNEKTIAVRARKQGDLGAMNLTDFVAMVKKEIEEKTNCL
ncbi:MULTISPECIES: threonine--tRNA ligase [Clostridium]|uniref:Threonine--tRNA ligase n=1 Tax=Clostridium novyi (strain NT) TaxID=386415 RepID=SYT_CLONN|nr:MULTISPECIES: threonine--tRNA ligase [Clostridium]A0PZN1.1 RecName: Full=Threonine--tRNA ligase; AltName: Full=Threonyl-tRNA synthetase; Short=ThrRS [Clostridium novyi NT]ABK61560.1 threonyl-tRNA synthetase [Clostridium novyi NT]KEH86120.1 threonyl-tRNA synthetase [Clostridium novyi A str. 4540]KEH88463.1 threonyl-tRNA synthetase [Clostridium novyi A str. NCTC 538]KEH90428.1 threonyl-tRNA synthetase [Clostridium novyi A str. BKT29909]KEH92150.1 threonyl-tRNA synthetase [Clostridium novyi A